MVAAFALLRGVKLTLVTASTAAKMDRGTDFVMIEFKVMIL